MLLMQLLERVWQNLLSRTSGPLHLRFVLQPTIAIILAARAGLADARQKKPAFLYDYFRHSTRRPSLLRSAWRDLAKIFSMGLALDVIYQLAVFRWLYPGEAILIALSLTVVPYVLVRGPVNRLTPDRARSLKKISS